MHTYATQGLCKNCGTFAISVAETLKTVYQSLLAQLGQKIVMEEKRMGSECEKKKKKTVEEGHSGFWQKEVPL